MVDAGPMKAGGAGAAAGGAVEAATGGLSRAAGTAGDVLRGIFGGLPWEMSADAIVNAVTPGLIDVGVLLL